ncbi:hypothetical protein MMC15_006417 [Xylographa vitiligo]|nr:hypothetical protein [Xylographa vitiligo]
MAAEAYSDFDLPWCQAILNSSDIDDFTTPTRRPPAPADRVITNTLFSETWRSDTAVHAWKTLRKHKAVDPNVSPEYMLLLSPGAGLGSFTNVLHGGAAAAILDQCIIIASFNSANMTMTKELKVYYKKSVPLPRPVLCRSVVTQRDGRALWLHASIEDGGGTVYCEADALCILAAQKSVAML